MAVVANLVVRVTAAITDFEKQMATMEKRWARQGAKLQSIGRDLTTGITLPLAALGGLAVKAASDFESSFAGVRKTVDGVVDAGGDLTDFGRRLQQEFRDLAKEIPVNVNELNKIGEMAGQLGIKSESIIDFTKTIAAMSVATNLSAEQAADGMARFANITQMPQENIGRLGSTIVELGNKLAATESEILEFGLRIAGAGEIVGMTEAQIMGIAGAFSSVGIEAEAGGTAVQKALLAMNSAVTTGKGLGAFGGAAFADKFKADPGEAFVGFIEAVGAAGKGGEQLLRNAGFDDQRQIRAFLSMAAAGDVLRTSLKLAGEEWARNMALTREAEQRYRTFESQVLLLKNQVYDLAITFGTQLIEALQRMMPAIQTVLGVIAKMVDWFSRLPEPVQLGAFAFAGFVAAIGPVTFVIGTLMKAGSAAMFVLKAIGPTIGALQFAFAGMGTAILGILGPLGALVAGLIAVNQFSKSETFLKWVSTSDDFSARAMRWAFSKDQLTEGQFSEAFAKMNGRPSPYAGDIHLPAEKAAAAGVPAIASPADIAAAQKLEEARQKQLQQMERIADLRKDLTGLNDIAAAKEITQALKITDLTKLDADAKQRVNETLIKGIDAIQRQGQIAPQAMRDMASATMPVLDEIGDSVQNINSLFNEMPEAIREASMVQAPLPPLVTELPTAAANLENLASMTHTVTAEMQQLSAVQAPKWWEEFFDVNGLQTIAGILGQLGRDFGGTAGAVMGGLSNIVAAFGAFKQNGMPKTALGKVAALADAAGAIWASTTAGGGATANALSGAASGAAAGMAFGPYGAAVGAGVGALVGFVKSRMVGQDEKDARKEALVFQDELIRKLFETGNAASIAEAQGERWRMVNIAVRDAYLAIGRSEAEAMRDLERFNAATHQSAEAVQAAAGVIGAAFDEHAADQQRLNDAIQRYGFEWEELGAKFRQTTLNNQAKELIEDWRVLVASGIGMETVNTRMAGAMNEFLQAALTAGTEVPAAMQPILQSFANQGLLVDAAGNKITDLKAAGVTFAETMTQGFERVVLKLDQLITSLIAAGTAIDPINAGLKAQAGSGGATPLEQQWLNYIAARGWTDPSIIAQAKGYAAQGIAAPAIPAMAEGGIVRRPTLALIGERGPEAVTPLPDGEDSVGRGGLTVIFQGDVYDAGEVKRRIAEWYHDAIETDGRSRGMARRLGVVPA